MRILFDGRFDVRKRSTHVGLKVRSPVLDLHDETVGEPQIKRQVVQQLEGLEEVGATLCTFESVGPLGHVTTPRVRRHERELAGSVGDNDAGLVRPPRQPVPVLASKPSADGGSCCPAYPLARDALRTPLTHARDVGDHVVHHLGWSRYVQAFLTARALLQRRYTIAKALHDRCERVPPWCPVKSRDRHIPDGDWVTHDGAVDASDDERPPWAYLDLLGDEPFFADYKVRFRELLALTHGQRHLDVGGGVGTDALAIRKVTGFAAIVEGIQLSFGFTLLAVGGLLGLNRTMLFQPLMDGVKSGSIQSVMFPQDVIANAPRIISDLRAIFRFRADILRLNGTGARRTPAMFGRAGLSDITVEGRTLIVRDPTLVDNVMGLRDWAQFAREAGAISDDEALAWPRMIDDAAAAGEFLYAVTYFVTAGTKPPT